MSRTSLTRMLSLSNTLVKQERAAAAAALVARADEEHARDRAAAATHRAAAARARGGEVAAFLASRGSGTALAQAAVDAHTNHAQSCVVADEAAAALTAQRIQLKAVQRLAQSRRDAVTAADLAAAQAVVDDAVAARFATRLQESS